ncbi:hypothetical protein BGW42_000454 [Actinomortierella wolfii]|nr:hypothetical protein BGW42_000454 [Actinomortierella wolfii]
MRLKERRPRVRSPSMCEFEDQDEYALIVSELEREPWQPDMLLERQMSPTVSSSCSSPPYQWTSDPSMNNPFWSPEDDQLRISQTSQKPKAVGVVSSSIVGVSNQPEMLLGSIQDTTDSQSANAASSASKSVLPINTKSPSSPFTTAVAASETEKVQSTTITAANTPTATAAAETDKDSSRDSLQLSRPRHQQQLEALQAYLSQAAKQQEQHRQDPEKSPVSVSPTSPVVLAPVPSLPSTSPRAPGTPQAKRSSSPLEQLMKYQQYQKQQQQLKQQQQQQQQQKQQQQEEQQEQQEQKQKEQEQQHPHSSEPQQAQVQEREQESEKPLQPEDLQRRNSFGGTPSVSLFLDGSDEEDAEERSKTAEKVPASTVAARRVTAPNILIPARVLLPPPPKTMPKFHAAKMATVSNITTDSFHTARSSLDENGAMSPRTPLARGFHSGTTASPLTPASITNSNQQEQQQTKKQQQQQTHQSPHLRQGLNDSNDIAAETEVILESLQALKDLSMLALDGLLQQVVSYATSQDPVFNPDEATLEARALLRHKTSSLVNQLPSAQERSSPASRDGQLTPVSPLEHGHPLCSYQEQQPQQQQSITAPMSSDAASASLERLDSLVRRVDQLAIVTGESALYDQPAATVSPSSSSPAPHCAAIAADRTQVLHEAADIPQSPSTSTFMGAPRASMDDPTANCSMSRRGSVEVSRIYETPEYQMACTLAALLACIYRILNRVQHPRPVRTESSDTGLDRASKLWKRLSSNPLSRAQATTTNNTGSTSATAATASSSTPPHSQVLMMMTPIGAVRQQHSTGSIVAGDMHPSSAATAVHRGLLMQSFTRQVRALRNRRTQSTGQLEAATGSSTSLSLLNKRLLGNGHGASASTVQLHPRDAQQPSKEAKALADDWNELDQLMDQMSHLWQHQEMLMQAIQQEQGRMDGVLTTPTSPTAVTGTSTTATAAAVSSTTATTTVTADTALPPLSPRLLQNHFDRQTLETAGEPLPMYDEIYGGKNGGIPGYHELYHHNGEKKTPEATAFEFPRRRSISPPFAVDDEKTRIDLSNVMSAIERLSRVAPRMDDQRVSASPINVTTATATMSSLRSSTMAMSANGAGLTRAATVTAATLRHHRLHGNHSISASTTDSQMADTLDRLAKGRLVDQRAHSSRADFSFVGHPSTSERSHRDKHRELNRLIRQIVESASKTTTNGYNAQRVEMSPRKQWQLEGARISQQIERSERMRIADQDWQSPEKVLLNDMTRLMDALSQRTETPVGFSTQRYVMTEEKARNLALQGILSKIEKLSDRRLDNQDAVLPRPGQSARSAAINSTPLHGITTTTTAVPHSTSVVSSWSLTSTSQHPHQQNIPSSSTPAVAAAAVNKMGHSHSQSYIQAASSAIPFRRQSLKAFDASNNSKFRADDHRELQHMMDKVLASGGSQTRKAAMAAQRAEFHH